MLRLVRLNVDSSEPCYVRKHLRENTKVLLRNVEFSVMCS